MEATADALDVGMLKFSSGREIGTGGFIDTPNQRLGIRHILPTLTPEELAQMPLDMPDGAKPTSLGDVATIVRDTQPHMNGDAIINDGLGLMLIVEKLPWGNTLEITRGVEAALEQMKPGLPGIEIDTTIFRPATFIEDALDNLSHAMILGFVLIVVVLVLFLYEWRVALISVLSIPLSLVAAGLVLKATGQSINTMVLAGLVIALGVIVDDAIIDVENIVRRIRQRRLEGSTQSTAAIVVAASLEVRAPIVHATLIILASAVPIFLLEGLAGSFFRPLGFAYALAILASMVVALTVTPALALLVVSKTAIKRRESPVAGWLQARYVATLEKIVQRPGAAYATFGVVMVAGLMVWPLLGQGLFPKFKERDFLMHWVARPGTSQEEMLRIVGAASKELRSIPGVRNFGAHIGQGTLADEPYGMNFAENWISIDRSADYDKTLAAVEEVVEGYPGLQRDVQTYLKERTKEVLSGSGHAIVVRVSGDDLAVLRTEGRGSPGGDRRYPGHHQRARRPRDRDPADPGRGGSRRGVALRHQARRRATGRLRVHRERGGGRHLSGREELRGARLGRPEEPQQHRERPRAPARWARTVCASRSASWRRWRCGRPRTSCCGRTARAASTSRRTRPPTMLGEVARQVENRVKKLDFPRGYYAEVLGEYQERQAAERRLLITSFGALVAILLILHTAFGSGRLTTLVALTLPFALVGGILATGLGDRVISLGSLVGLLTVLGIAARNGILMISRFQHLEHDEGETFGPALVLRGAKERLSPILMTSLAAGLGVVPLVIGGSIPGNEIEHPMAVAILGGLVTSTVLNLFVVPSLYLRFAKPRSSRDGRRSRQQRERRDCRIEREEFRATAGVAPNG